MAFFIFHLPLPVNNPALREARAGIWGPELKQKPQRFPYCLALSGLLSLLSFIVQDHLPKSGITQSGRGHPIDIANQENSTTDLYSNKANLLVKVSSSHVKLACAKLAKANQHEWMFYQKK